MFGPFPDVVVTVAVSMTVPVAMTVPVSMSVATIQGEMSQAIQLHGRLSDGREKLDLKNPLAN